MTLAVIRDVVQIVCALATTAAALKYFMAPAEAGDLPICATCIRPGERVRGCRNGRQMFACSRCGWPTTGTLVGPEAPATAVAPSGGQAPTS